MCVPKTFQPLGLIFEINIYPNVRGAELIFSQPPGLAKKTPPINTLDQGRCHLISIKQEGRPTIKR